MSDSALPTGWTPAILSDLVDVVRPRVDPRTLPHLPFVGMDHVEAHKMKLLGTIPAATMKSNAVAFEPGDVLYGRLRPYLNKVLMASFKGLASAEFIPLTPRIGVEGSFVAYRLNSADFVSYTSHLDEGDRPRVDWSGISRFRIDTPPSGEQRRIVEEIDSYLSRLDAAVASLERAQARLKAYRASVLKAAAEGRLVPTEAELARAEKRDYEPANVLLKRILAERRRRWEEAERGRSNAGGNAPKDNAWKARYPEPATPTTESLPDLPAGWCWASMEQIADVSGGLTKNGARDTLRLYLPYLRVANVYANMLALDEIKTIGVRDSELQRLLVRRGDLLIVEGNGSVDQIGRVALWDGSIEPIVHQNHLIKARFAVESLQRWTLTWLLSPRGRRVIELVASSTSGLHTLSISKIEHLPVPVPPIAEQERILAQVDELASIVDADTTSIRTSRRRCGRLRQAVLKSAFEGKLVAQDAADEPAERLLARILARGASPAPSKRSPRARPKATR